MRKRWMVGFFVVLCASYWAWPYLGAYGLAAAAERHDVASVANRVDFPAFKRSLTRQVVRAYLKQSGRAEKLGAYGRGMALSVGASVADPYLVELLTPETVASLLSDGHLKPVTVENRTIAFDQALPRLGDLFGNRALQIVLGSYYDGLRSFVFHVAGNGPGTAGYGIHLALSGTTWRLSGVDLPDALIDRITADIIAKEKASKQS